MFCLGGAPFDAEQPIPARPKQLVCARGTPAWLHTFVDSEDYLSKCTLNCFRTNMKQALGERPPTSHRRRYFCTDCPDEGAICLGSIIEQHLKHRVLKVRKVTGVGGHVIKVRDIEPLLNISYVLRQWCSNDDIAYVKLKTYRQSVWGADSDQVICFECLKLADSEDSLKYKFCSIKCAYANAANSVPSSTVQDLDDPQGLISSKPRNVQISFRHRRKLTISAPLEFEALSQGKTGCDPPSMSDSPPPPKGWRSRLSNFLTFNSSKRRSSPMEAPFKKPIPYDVGIITSLVSSLSTSSQQRRSGWEKFKTSPAKSSQGDQRGSKESKPGQTQASGRPPRNTLQHERHPQDNDMVKQQSPQSPSKDGSPCSSSQDLDNSWLSKASTGAPLSKSVNVKAGPVTTICWKAEQGYGSDEEVVQGKWGSVRTRVLNSAGTAYATYDLENEPEQTSRGKVELYVSGFQPMSPSARASQELAVSSGPCETIQAHGCVPVIDSFRRMSGDSHLLYKKAFMVRRNAL